MAALGSSYVRKGVQVLKDEGPRQLAHRVRDRVRRGGQGGEHCQVLFVDGCDPSVPHPSRYRVAHQIEQLEMCGISADRIHFTEIGLADGDRADVLVLFRCPITREIEQVVEHVHNQGKKVYFDVDDLVVSTNYTDNLPLVRSMTEQEKAIFDDGVERTGKTLALCDAAITTTGRLAAELAKHVGEVHINRNVASLEMVAHSSAVPGQRQQRDADAVAIGYFSGSMTHNQDFECVHAALRRLMDERAYVNLHVVGDLELPDDLQAFESRVVRHEAVDWRALPALIGSIDINIAPLEDTIFNQAKSENKWVEAALVKVPTVASRVGAFEEMIAHGETGLLCGSESEWYDALALLADNSIYRRDMGQRAYRFCMDHCTTIGTGYRLADILVGLPHTIDAMLPASDAVRQMLVDDYLAARGFASFGSPLDPEPWEGVGLQERMDHVRAAHEAGKKVVAFLYERGCGDDATFRYFGYNSVERLELSNAWAADYFFLDEASELEALAPVLAGVVMVRMRIRPDLQELLEKLKAQGVPVGYLIDDNALGSAAAPRVVQAMVADPESTFEVDFWYGACERFAAAARQADCLVATSERLAQVFAGFSDAPVALLHASLNNDQVAIAKQIEQVRMPALDQRFTIGYFSGTASHGADFRMIQEPLGRFLRAHDDVLLLLVGNFELDQELLALLEQDKVKLLPRVDYGTLQYLQASVDVVLAPLVEDEFTHCKGALKVFEAGVVGTPACASATDGYRIAVEHGRSGFLCHAEQDWFDALEALHDQPAMARDMANAARDHALARFWGAQMLDELEAACAVLCQAPQRPLVAFDNEAYCALTAQRADFDDPFAINAAVGQACRASVLPEERKG